MEILQLPVLSASSRDRLVWKENQPKLFNVKSTYQVALRLKHQARIEHFGVRSDRVVWKNVWAFNVPLKACMFKQFLLEIIYIKGEFKLTHGVRYVASKLNQLPIFCGNVLSREMCGLFAEAKYRNSRMMHMSFSLFSAAYWKSS